MRMWLQQFVILAAAALVMLVGLLVIVAISRRGKRDHHRQARATHGGPPALAVPGPMMVEAPMERETAKLKAGSRTLVATRGPLAPQQFPIPANGLSIGRHPDNNIVLADELMVSRFHAVIALEDGQSVLYDRDSGNGTWVNEQRVFRHVLMPGDRIQIWQSQFVFSAADAPVAPPPPPPQPEISARPTIHVEGEQFGDYRLENLVGRGGMSEVFKARDANGHIVAIKILQQTDPYLVAKFVQEGNKIGPLLRGHPNIIYVHEFGRSPDNRLYIVMEYVDAPSLRRSLHGPWGETDTVKTIGQVCSALAFAHRNNIVHRDIKPENILLAADGVVKVLDFGIAKLTSASTVTRDKIVGTPEYISPEQARGDPVQPASDVYSLGIVLYEMLTGSVPFPRPREADPYQAAIEVVRQHLKSEPEPMRKRNPGLDISTRVERTTMRALKKNVKDRYETARELGQALGYRDADTVGFQGAQPPAPRHQAAACLAILQGPRQGERIPLGQVTTLGRFELGSTNTTISRRHANIFYRGGGYWLEDTSTNGTWVDNVRVYGEVPLRAGATVTIGENVLRLEAGAG